jgi:hypothetical protein
MVRPITEKDREPLRKLSFEPYELIELKNMNTKDLRGLMCFCGIRVYEDMPVIACEDDELRMAYLVWRSYYSREKRVELNKKLAKVQKYGFKIFDEIKENLSII